MDKFDLGLIKDVISIVAFILALALFVIATLLRRKNTKKSNDAATRIESAANNILAIRGTVQNAIVLAEKFIDYTGEDKKQWVTTYTKEKCIEKGIKYTDAEISNTIEDLISFSKHVNATDEKRIEAAKEEEAKNE